MRSLSLGREFPGYLSDGQQRGQHAGQEGNVRSDRGRGRHSWVQISPLPFPLCVSSSKPLPLRALVSPVQKGQSRGIAKVE